VASWADGHFNPVVFHGPYGFGKTHLLNALAWEALRTAPGKRVVYLSAERFTTTFVKALQDKQTQAFKEELRNADLLLIDDVHFVAGKTQTQEELFHTLIALVEDGRRVVLTADRSPTELSEMEPRLRSHLQAGLVCGIEPADRNLRLGILERKLHTLAQNGGFVPAARPEVLQFLADRFTDSVRELEGALNTLVARVGGDIARLTLDEAQAILRPHLSVNERKVTVDMIQKAVAEHFGLKQADLISERRARAVARPRQVAMWLAKQITTRSLPDIGRRFGGRDHTTVLHAGAADRGTEGGRRDAGARLRRAAAQAARASLDLWGAAPGACRKVGPLTCLGPGKEKSGRIAAAARRFAELVVSGAERTPPAQGGARQPKPPIISAQLAGSGTPTATESKNTPPAPGSVVLKRMVSVLPVPMKWKLLVFQSMAPGVP
jgi:hypothetical protein